MALVDIHNHLLPGVDDGAGDMEESLAMLEMAHGQGVEAMILTPHNKAGMRCVSPEGIGRRLGELQNAAAERGLGLRLYGGMEIYYREGVAEELEEGRLCTLAGSRYALVEFHPMEEFDYIQRAVYSLSGAGLVPVLAHVERYQHLAPHCDRVELLVARGAKLQVNASSLAKALGLWGKGKSLLKPLFARRLVHCISTDAHDLRHRPPDWQGAIQYLHKMDKGYAQALLGGNARRILEDLPMD